MSLRTVAFHTLGCKLNFSETAAISRQFEAAGFSKETFENGADVYVINSCSVTQNADSECRNIINRALNINPDAFVAVIGCFAQLQPEKISSMEGVDIILGASEKFNIVAHVGEGLKRHKAGIFSCDIADVNDFISSYSLDERTRAFLKVQDGCDYSCSFCTIPLARGKSRSNSINNVLKEVDKIAANGVKEIVLTGVNLGDFSFDVSPGKKNIFIDLIRELDKNTCIPRFRISSIEPNLLTPEIIEFVAASKKFMPHFHIPLQSGSDKILKLMRRRYLTHLYADKIKMIRELIPHCCIGADVMTGFPSESPLEFQETYDFLKDIDVSYLHVFTYSERPNTFASALSGKVPVGVRKERNNKLRALSAIKLSNFYDRHKGQKMNVLFEAGNKNGIMHGFSENYIKVKTPYDPSFINHIVEITIGEIAAGEMAMTEK